MQVCSNDVVDIACGFTGADPTTVPYLRIVKRNNIGGFNSIIIRGNRVTNNSVDGLVWVPDLNSGPNNSPNSKFVVGPVNRTLNLSLFRCGFPVSGGSNIESSIGRLVVLGKMCVGYRIVNIMCHTNIYHIGPPLIKNFTVTESCSTSLLVSWQTVSYPECGNMTYVLAVTLHRTSFMTVTTSANHHSFTGLKSNTSYNITIVPRYKGVLGSAEAITMSTTNDQNSKAKCVYVIHALIFRLTLLYSIFSVKNIHMCTGILCVCITYMYLINDHVCHVYIHII